MSEIAIDRRQDARWLTKRSIRPPLGASLKVLRRKAYLLTTGALVTLFFTLMQITGTMTTWTAVLEGFLILFLFVAVAGTLDWFKSARDYLIDLEERSRVVRARLLVAAGFHPNPPAELHKHKMLEIRRDKHTGVLQIAIDNPAGTGLSIGSRLSVLFTATESAYGSVTVDRIDNGFAVVVPSDRSNYIFWEGLEDQADLGQQPPSEVHLEFDAPDWLLIERHG